MLFPEHLRPELRLVFDAVAAGEHIGHFETEIRRKDGMPVPISLSVAPVFDAGHRLLGAVLIGRDITEQRLGQATLAELETLMRETEALAHVGTWLWDVASDVVQWSDELHRILRRRSVGLRGHPRRASRARAPRGRRRAARDDARRRRHAPALRRRIPLIERPRR